MKLPDLKIDNWESHSKNIYLKCKTDITYTPSTLELTDAMQEVLIGQENLLIDLASLQNQMSQLKTELNKL
jgi:hypothetical protein